MIPATTPNPSGGSPKISFSYSWTSFEYGERVVKLAEQLTSDGIDVVLDRWHLREGQDKHQFMERLVNDSEAVRVLVLCDPMYAAKADGRDGGVGSETLIISPEVYRQADQHKFIPVIMERDVSGRIVVPTYLTGRIYIDLSDPATEDRQYQRLVRNIFGKPELQPPPLGTPPGYLNADAVVLITGRTRPNFQDAVTRGLPHQAGFLAEYLSRVVEAFKSHDLEAGESIVELEERAVRSIEQFLPYRDEFVQTVQFIGRFGDDKALYGRLHEFFEQLLSIRYLHRATRWAEELETEHLAFLAWEMFLCSVAALVRAERFDAIRLLLDPYFVKSAQTGAGALMAFDVLDPGFRLLDDIRRQRLQLRYTSVAVKMLQDRATQLDLPFEALMEADTLLWLRTAVDSSAENQFARGWYPKTLHYAERISTLPLFVRAQSKGFFSRLKIALGVTDRDDLVARLNTLEDDTFPKVGNFWGGRGRYAQLLQIDSISTRP